MRKLEFMWKDNTSPQGHCPAIYRTDGGYVVQGKQLEHSERTQLRDLADDEDAVFVPTNVLDRLAGG